MAFPVLCQDSLSVITIKDHRKKQVITSIGGNYCQATYTNDAWDEVAEFTLQNLKPTHIRFPIPLKKWEPENDNESARSLDISGFNHQGTMKTLFEMLARMKEEYGVTSFTAAVWDAPDWMIENPEASQQRKIKKSHYQEALESIGAFMVEARDNYGITVDYFSFNEATGGYQILFTPEEIIEFISIGGPYFRSLGLPTKFLTADSHKTGGTTEYARPLLQNDSITQYLGPLSYHSWWSDNLPDEEFKVIADQAQKYNLPVWCTELGYDAMLYKDKSKFPTWENAWKLAKVNHRVLKYSEASLTQYWTYQNNFPIVSPDGDPFPIYYTIKQNSDYLPNGSQVVQAESSDPDLWVISALLPEYEFMTQILNVSEQQKQVILQNVPSRKIYLVRTSENHNLEIVEELTPTGRSVEANLPPRSMNTFVTKILHQ